MKQIALFNAVSKNNNFNVTIDGRPFVVKVPDDEIILFKEENKLTYFPPNSAYCNQELVGRKIEFTDFTFEKSGDNSVTYCSAKKWSWIK